MAIYSTQLYSERAMPASVITSNILQQFEEIPAVNEARPTDSSLEEESSDNLNNAPRSFDDAKRNDPMLTFLLNNKFQRNLNIVKALCVRSTVLHNNDTSNSNGDGKYEYNVDKYQDSMAALEFKSSDLSFKTLDIMQKSYEKYQNDIKKRRFSVDFDDTRDVAQQHHYNKSSSDGIKNEEEVIDDEDSEIKELRKRLLGNRRPSFPEGGSATGTGTDSRGIQMTVDKQLEDHDNVQENLIQDMTKLVSSLKEGAVAFQNALDEDKKVLGAAEIGIQVASKGISNVSGKLKTYDKNKLGWMFYILATLFMFLGLIVTFVIIKLFPAL